MNANRVRKFLPKNRVTAASVAAATPPGFVALPAAMLTTARVSPGIYQVAYAAAVKQVAARRRRQARQAAARWN